MNELFWSHDVRVNLVPTQINRKVGYKQNCIVLTSRESGRPKEIIYISSGFSYFNERRVSALVESERSHSWRCWTLKRELVNKAYFVKVETNLRRLD